MLPLLVIFLLVQSISATNEFPDLMENIIVTWDGVDISSQLDSRLTSSFNNQVEYFILWGPSRTLGNGGYCKTETYYETHYSETNITRTHSYWGTDVRHIGPYSPEHNSSFTCIAFPNLVPDFMNHKQHTWYANFTCETVKPTPKPAPKPEPETKSDSKPTGVYVIGVVIGMAIIGYIAFEIGKKKGCESSQGAYKTLGAHKTINGGGPSYGNPFVQTA